MTQCGAKLAIRLTNDRGDVVAVATDFRCMFERERHAADPILDHCYTLRWPSATKTTTFCASTLTCTGHE